MKNPFKKLQPKAKGTSGNAKETGEGTFKKNGGNKCNKSEDKSRKKSGKDKKVALGKPIDKVPEKMEQSVIPSIQAKKKSAGLSKAAQGTSGTVGKTGQGAGAQQTPLLKQVTTGATKYPRAAGKGVIVPRKIVAPPKSAARKTATKSGRRSATARQKGWDTEQMKKGNLNVRPSSSGKTGRKAVTGTSGAFVSAGRVNGKTSQGAGGKKLEGRQRKVSSGKLSLEDDGNDSLSIISDIGEGTEKIAKQKNLKVDDNADDELLESPSNLNLPSINERRRSTTIRPAREVLLNTVGDQAQLMNETIVFQGEKFLKEFTTKRMSVDSLPFDQAVEEIRGLAGGRRQFVEDLATLEEASSHRRDSDDSDEDFAKTLSDIRSLCRSPNPQANTSVMAT